MIVVPRIVLLIAAMTVAVLLFMLVSRQLRQKTDGGYSKTMNGLMGAVVKLSVTAVIFAIAGLFALRAALDAYGDGSLDHFKSVAIPGVTLALVVTVFLVIRRRRITAIEAKNRLRI